MPFSILLHGYPTSDAPVASMQGPALQGMFLALLREVDPAVNDRLHNDAKYRPYTLSPLGIGEPARKTPPSPPQGGNYRRFQGFRLPRQSRLRRGTPCYVRLTLLEDMLFPTFSRYFLSRPEPTFRLGETEFTVTNVVVTSDEHHPWTGYCQYSDLIKRASSGNRKITLHFLTPTSFRRGDVDVPLPDVRLVFRNYRKRFEAFCQYEFLPDFEDQAERYTGIARLKHLETNLIKTKKITLAGFTGVVAYELNRYAPRELIRQMNLLADFAVFCGTGRKTTVGMGQTLRSAEAQR